MQKRKIIIVLIIVIAIAILVVIGSKILADIINKQNVIVPSRRASDAEKNLNTVLIDGKQYQRRDGIETYLIIGLDSYGPQKSSNGYYNKDQADYLLLVSIDSENRAVRFLTINRDTICSVNQLGIGGSKYGEASEQIALAHTYGDGMQGSCENVVDAVSGLLFGTKIENYASITMDGVAKLNDYIGGVMVDDRMLFGDESLAYVRGRIGVDDSTNIARMERQNKYISALVDTVRKIDLNSSFVDGAIESVSEYLLTNIDLIKLYDILDRTKDYEFEEIVTPEGQADYSGEYTEFYVNEESLKEIAIEMFY